MLRTLSSGAAACAAVAGRLITVASVMFPILALLVRRVTRSTHRRHHPRVIQYSRGACDQSRSRGVLDLRFRGDDSRMLRRLQARLLTLPAEPLGLARQVDRLHLLHLD